jgi:hypothetical protein
MQYGVRSASDGGGRAGRAGLNVPGNLPMQPPSGFISHTGSLLLRCFFLAAIFSEPEGLFSVYTPALSNLRFEAACIFWSAPARNSGNIQPGAPRPPAAIACLFCQNN